MKRINWSTKDVAPSPEYVQQLHVGMRAVLEHRLAKGLPLKVMRPLVYQTSVMDTMKPEEDDGFYQVRKSTSLGKFIDINLTIPVGTELLLKSIDAGMQEFIFSEKGSKTEHAISFDLRDSLSSQTDILETVQEFLETNGD